MERSQEKNKLSLVKWDHVTRPKDIGGLRLRKVVHINKVCLAEFHWRIIRERQSKWANTQYKKYMHEAKSVENQNITLKNKSGLANLRAPKGGIQLMKNSITWVLGNDNTIRFWKHD